MTRILTAAAPVPHTPLVERADLRSVARARLAADPELLDVDFTKLFCEPIPDRHATLQAAIQWCSPSDAIAEVVANAL